MDPEGFNASDVGGYHSVLNTYLRRDETPGRSVTDLKDALGDRGEHAFVLCTGPSASAVDFADVRADVRIVCNSAVRNEELLADLSPNIITFADPVFHFGPSAYAATFRRDMLRAFHRTRAWLAVPDLLGRLLLHHHPELTERTVLLNHSAPDWTWPGHNGTEDIRPTDNILTLSMLPLAFALADRVFVAGCDGREPGARYFWSHSSQVQYPDVLMRSVWAAHPSFFRDRNYEDYYDQHCRELEEFIVVAESSGKSVTSITRSHIPALANRQRG